jgi:hypothetical protein
MRAFTIALSNESDISRTLKTAQMMKTETIPPNVPVISYPSQTAAARPTTVKIMGHVK